MKATANETAFTDVEIKRYAELRSKKESATVNRNIRCDGIDWARLTAKMETARERVLKKRLEVLADVPAQTEPIFLISYGAPGSGKSACVDNVFKRLRPPSGVAPQNIVQANVDDIVAELDTGRTISVDAENYSVFRPTADNVAGRLLYVGMERGVHLNLETTGNSVDVQWFTTQFENARTQHRYLIALAYPLVAIPTLVARVQQRAAASSTSSSKRRPDDDAVVNAARNAARNVALLMALVDKLLIYDNSGDVASGACQTEILVCDRQSCVVNCEWLTSPSMSTEEAHEKCIHNTLARVLEKIKERFGVSLSLDEKHTTTLKSIVTTTV